MAMTATRGATCQRCRWQIGTGYPSIPVLTCVCHFGVGVIFHLLHESGQMQPHSEHVTKNEVEIVKVSSSISLIRCPFISRAVLIQVQTKMIQVPLTPPNKKIRIDFEAMTRAPRRSEPSNSFLLLIFFLEKPLCKWAVSVIQTRRGQPKVLQNVFDKNQNSGPVTPTQGKVQIDHHQMTNAPVRLSRPGYYESLIQSAEEVTPSNRKIRVDDELITRAPQRHHLAGHYKSYIIQTPEPKMKNCKPICWFCYLFLRLLRGYE